MLKVAQSKNTTIAISSKSKDFLDKIKKAFEEKNGFDIGDKHALDLVITRCIQNAIFPEIIIDNAR